MPDPSKLAKNVAYYVQQGNYQKAIECFNLIEELEDQNDISEVDKEHLQKYVDLVSKYVLRHQQPKEDKSIDQSGEKRTELQVKEQTVLEPLEDEKAPSQDSIPDNRQESEDNSNHTQTERANRRGQTDTEIRNARLVRLRKRAEKSSKEEVASTAPHAPHSEYSRSQAVKKYALARATGMCEWCESPAPFANKQGEPYLEVHHVHELGNGGPDSPDTVVALCPTCHCQIHYGEGGDEINKNLIQMLNEGLAEIGKNNL